jgi:uncharacterized membrane protein
MARHSLSTKIFTSASMATDLASLVSNIANIDAVSMQIDFGAGATGSFSLQVSDNYAAADPTLATWVTIPVLDQNGAAPSISGSAGTFFLNAWVTATWCRLIYTRGSGSGTLNAMITGKGAG